MPFLRSRFSWAGGAALLALSSRAGAEVAPSSQPEARAEHGESPPPRRELRGPAPPEREWTPEDAERFAPHHARSLWQMGAGLALGTTGYWVFQERNVVDWDNPRLEERFSLDSWIFDNNSLAVNYLGHPGTGGLSYSFARANHQSVAGAYGYAFLTSFLWEFLLEFKEKVSVNDLIVTPGAGLPIGEYFYKLGMYLDSAAGSSTGVDVARWALGTGVALDRTLDGRPPPRVLSRTQRGFTRTIWHDFSLRYGAQAIATPSEPDFVRYRGGLASRLVTLPGYLLPRSFGRAFWRAEVSDFSMSLEGSPHGAGVFFAADTLLAGYHAQSMRRVGREVRGDALTAGTNVGFAFLRSSANVYRSVERAVALPAPRLRQHVPSRHEQYAAFHFTGLGVDVRSARSWGGLQLSARAHPSFGALSAAAFYDWTAANLEERGKYILHRQGYFYGWGGAANAKAALAVGPLRAGFELIYASYYSQQGFDRHAERVTVDVPAWGDVLLYEGSLGVAPEGVPLTVSLDLGVRRFRSEVGGFARTARAVERGLSTTWSF